MRAGRPRSPPSSAFWRREGQGTGCPLDGLGQDVPATGVGGLHAAAIGRKGVILPVTCVRIIQNLVDPIRSAGGCQGESWIFWGDFVVVVMGAISRSLLRGAMTEMMRGDLTITPTAVPRERSRRHLLRASSRSCCSGCGSWAGAGSTLPLRVWICWAQEHGDDPDSHACHGWRRDGGEKSVGWDVGALCLVVWTLCFVLCALCLVTCHLSLVTCHSVPCPLVRSLSFHSLMRAATPALPCDFRPLTSDL